MLLTIYLKKISCVIIPQYINKYHILSKHRMFNWRELINSVKHYENFPVASLLLPKNLRSAVQHIYAFARSADDIADEGDLSPYERLADLKKYSDYLKNIENYDISATQNHPHLFINLADTIYNHQLPIEEFQKLLVAFKQDVLKNSYQTKQHILNYCQYSANPVGRILLRLYKINNATAIAYSDKICTALQLVNFYQDISIDCGKNRYYLAQDVLCKYMLNLDDIRELWLCTFSIELPKTHIKQHRYWLQWQSMMKEEVTVAQNMLIAGLPLCKMLPKKIGLELKIMIYAAYFVCEKIHQCNYDVFNQRPVLKWYNWITIIKRALI
jgi:squalene synthase HpnC